MIALRRHLQPEAGKRAQRQLVTDGLGPEKVGTRSCCIGSIYGLRLGRLWIGCYGARGIRKWGPAGGLSSQAGQSRQAIVPGADEWQVGSTTPCSLSLAISCLAASPAGDRASD